MQQIRRIREYEILKVLSDTRRLTITRLLMAAPATLSQLGDQLGEHPARVRHHLLKLEKAKLVELVETRPVRGFLEKYYRATANAFLLHDLILPEWENKQSIALVGSHDMALELLAAHMRKQKKSPVELVSLPVGSLEGLIALRQGIAQAAGCHLLDPDSGDFNLAHIRLLLPDRRVRIFTLAHRSLGLVLAYGNPLGIHSLFDLAREDVVFINRNPGSGTRVWLDRQLNQLDIPGETVAGYSETVRTHTEVAQKVHQHQADAGLCIEAAARKFNMNFIPLLQERFDLVVAEESLEDHRLSPVFEYLQNPKFRKIVDQLGGYDTAHTGDQITPLAV